MASGGLSRLKVRPTNKRLIAALLALAVPTVAHAADSPITITATTLDVALTSAPGSVGEFGWSGAAKTHYWVDPEEQVVGLFMTQSMLNYDLPELDLRALAYQAIDD